MPTPRPGLAQRRIALLVLISLGLHGLGLWAIHIPAPPLSLTERGHTLTLEWLGEASPLAPSSKPPTPEPPRQPRPQPATNHPGPQQPKPAPARQPEPKLTAVATIEKHAPDTPSPNQAERTPQAESRPSQAMEKTTPQVQPTTASPHPSMEERNENNTDIEENMTNGTKATTLADARQALRLRLAHHIEKRYPRLARQRGWEGEVLLGFRIDPQGRIGDIHIARSSGYPLLDRSALKSLARIKRIPLTTPRLSETIEMDLAIDYRLEDI